jgi:peptidoglycan/LPS O-acetylase OafA/YrhL
MSPILTFLSLQAGWFACVLGAASGRPLVGVLVVLLVVVAHLVTSADRLALALTLAAAAVVGLVVDGSLTLTGVLTFPAHASLGWPVPLWMLALWVNFALAIDALAWLGRRPAAAMLAGAIGGPLSYLAGARLGAVTLGPSEPLALGAVAVAWMVAMPLLLCGLPALARRGLRQGKPGLGATGEAS